MQKGLESNIWKYGAYLVTNKKVYVAILGAYYLTVPDVTAQSIGVILLCSMLAGFLFEIPSGYISDKLGHKKAMVLAKVLGLISTTFYLFSDNIWFLIFGAVTLSIGVAFHSGTGSAFLHETLLGLKREDEYARISGKLSSIGFAIPIMLSAAIPFLVSISYTLPFLIGLFIDAIGVAVAISLVSPHVPQHEVEEIRSKNFVAVMKDGYRYGIFPFLLFSGILFAIFLCTGRFRAPYQVFLEIPVIWYGIFHGSGRILASVILAYTGRIRDNIFFLVFIDFRFFFLGVYF
jgi:MFS family permease